MCKGRVERQTSHLGIRTIHPDKTPMRSRLPHLTLATTLYAKTRDLLLPTTSQRTTTKVETRDLLPLRSPHRTSKTTSDLPSTSQRTTNKRAKMRYFRRLIQPQIRQALLEIHRHQRKSSRQRPQTITGPGVAGAWCTIIWTRTGLHVVQEIAKKKSQIGG